VQNITVLHIFCNRRVALSWRGTLLLRCFPLGKTVAAIKTRTVKIFSYPFVSGGMIAKLKYLTCTYNPVVASMARVEGTLHQWTSESGAATISRRWRRRSARVAPLISRIPAGEAISLSSSVVIGSHQIHSQQVSKPRMHNMER
jgi:hypothetical protein